MHLRKTQLLIWIIFSVSIINCTNVARENFLIKTSNSLYIQSIGFTKTDNSQLNKDYFIYPSESDETILLILPADMNDFSSLTVSFELSSSSAQLGELDDNIWTEWITGETQIAFSDLTEKKRLIVKSKDYRTKEVNEKEYFFQLKKPVWLRLKEWKWDYDNENGQNIVLYLQLVDQSGFHLVDTRVLNGVWKSSDGITTQNQVEILNYPPSYDPLNNVFALNVKPFENGRLTMKFPDGLFMDEHGASAVGLTAVFNIEASWMDDDFTVTFYSNGAEPKYLEKSVKFGETVSFPEKDYFKMDNNVLEGWYFDDELFVNRFDESIRVTNNITVYARWTSDTAPGKPAILRIVPGNNRMALLWSPPIDFGMVTGEIATSVSYSLKVYEFSNLVDVLTSNDSITNVNYIVDDLEPDTVYAFELQAFNGGNLASPIERVTESTNATPEAPGVILTTVPDSQNTARSQIEIKLTEPNIPGTDGGSVAEILHYTIYYSNNDIPGDFLSNTGVNLESVDTTADEYTFDDLTPETKYYFRVIAVNSSELQGSASDQKSIITAKSYITLLEEEINALIIRDLENQDKITGNFNLPVSGINGTAISWEIVTGQAYLKKMDNSSTVSVILPQNSDDNVKLKATITRNNVSKTKEFERNISQSVTISDSDAVTIAYDYLNYNNFTFTHGEDETTVSNYFGLPVTGAHNASISWAVSSGSAIDIDNNLAMINRNGISPVTLKAEIDIQGTIKTKTFDITVSQKKLSDYIEISNSSTSVVLRAGSKYVIPVNMKTEKKLIPGVDYKLEIDSSDKKKVSIDENGIITLGDGISLNEIKTYTITATAVDSSSYQGTVTGQFELKVSITGFNLSSFDIFSRIGYSWTSTQPVPMSGTVELSNDIITYSINGEIPDDTGLSFDENTGQLFGPMQKSFTQTYLVAIKDVKDSYKYSLSKHIKSFTIYVTIPQEVISLSNGYDITLKGTEITGTPGTEKVETDFFTVELPDDVNLTPKTHYTISLMPANEKIQLNDNGSINIQSDITEADKGVYTIILEGMEPDCTGSVSSDFTLTIESLTENG